MSLKSGDRINFDKGQVVQSGGDLLWDGTTLTTQGAATLAVLANLGTLQNLKTYYQSFKTVAKSMAIPTQKIKTGTGLAVFTNGGNTAGALITAVSGGSITIQYITFGVTPTGPQIDSVLNNSSLIPTGAVNSGIAPSSIFIVKGENLANTSPLVLQSSAAPGIPLELNGASLTVVVNGTTVHPALYYTSPTQLAAVLPAATPVGNGTITAEYNNATSAAFPIQVVAHAPGINTYYVNTAVATDGARLLTFTDSATPGETITLWTTGLGADPADSDTVYTATPHSVNAPVQVYIGGIAANVLYHGSAGYPGVTQVNVTIPSSVPNGCWISIAVVAGSAVGNVATLPVHAGGGACVDELTGLNGNQITPSGGTTIRGGLVAIGKTNTPSKSGRSISSFTDAAFEKYVGVYQPPYSLSPGSCIVTYDVAVPIPQIIGLDPGSISLTGPGGLSVQMKSQGIKGAFYSLIDQNAVPDAGGTFTFTGTGGADVGKFTSVLVLNPLLVWTNPTVADNVDRSKDLTVKWTGGNSGSYVYISGTTGTGPNSVPVSFKCLAHTDDGGFTVPSHILSALQPGVGAIQVQNIIFAPLPASGLDSATAEASISFSESGTFK
ncbi:MAG TPA: hypothetical protein VFW44_09390 [Bryobacteraceae bacterium]|nr:hypothetical protein [Bryobacteraceae bacterium]